MHKLQELVVEYTKKNSIKHLSQRCGVGEGTIQKIIWGKKYFYVFILETLYDFFDLEKDDYYKKNMMNRLEPNKGVVGALLRIKRIEKGMSLDQVARAIKWTKRELIRIELGENLPTQNSQYIIDLMGLYELDKDEQQHIRRYIAILKDLVRIVHKYDKYGYFCHWKHKTNK